MFYVLLILLLCTIVNGTTDKNLIRFEGTLRDGFRDLFTNGNINDEFAKSVRKIELEHFFYPYPKNVVDSDLICSGCSIALDAVLCAVKNGVSKDAIANIVITLCQTLQIQSNNVCKALIKINIDILWHIISNKEDISGKKMCAVILQNFGCATTNPNPEWSINIHNGQTIEKPIGNNKPFNILHLTDIHYDPLYKPGSLTSCIDQVCCQYDSGEVESMDDGAGYWTDYGKCDIPPRFLEDSLSQIANTHMDIDYIYFTGDIISHRSWATDIYNNTIDIVSVLQSLKDHFKNIPVFPILGNHESHPLDQWSPHNAPENISTQWVFNLTANEWGRWLSEDTKETILKGGYYTILVKPGLRIIALNSNVGYSYNWWLLLDDVDPFDQLQWLENVLYKAEQNNEAVHILSHVPSGDSLCYRPWGRVFKKIVERYSNTITGIFNGHTHNDEISVYYRSDKPAEAINVAINGGSFSAYSYLNPNYKIISVDSKIFDVLDFSVWTMNVSEANLSPNQSPVWYKLYSFKDAYGVNSLSPSDFQELAVRMAKQTDKRLLQQYFRYISREGPIADIGCNETCLKDILCLMVRSVYGDNETCNILLDQWV